MATFSKDHTSNKPTGVVFKLNEDGTENAKYIDLLDEDKTVAGQKFTCISFISPEKVIKQRELFNFQDFLKQWDMNKSLEKFNQFLSFLSYKYTLNFDNLTKDLQEFCSEEKDKLFTSSLEDEFKNFMDMNETRLEEEFNSKHSFQTSVRGVKIRGSYPSQQEAELRCKMLREVDPNHDVYVGPVGTWMPFHPEAYKTGRVEYLEDELNQLMQEKDKNEKFAKVEFDKRVRESKEKAIQENIKKATETGNVLTQTINANGQLVNVKDMNNADGNVLEVSDVRRELFEGDNIVIDYKNSDHGISQLQSTP
jgi:vacuolar-type H+-ATPase subunit I/STV1